MMQAYSNHLKLRCPPTSNLLLLWVLRSRVSDNSLRWRLLNVRWNAALSGRTSTMRCSSRVFIWKCQDGSITNSGSRFQRRAGRTSWLISRLRMISTCMLNRRSSVSSRTCWRRGRRTSTGASSQECCTKLLGDQPVRSRRSIPECPVTWIVLI